MMDIDLGPVVAYMLVIVGVVFLAGFIITFTIVYFIFKKKNNFKGFPRQSKFFLVSIPLALLGGWLALQALFLWHSYEEDIYDNKRIAFGQEMTSIYVLSSVELTSNEELAFTFKVPRAAIYSVNMYATATATPEKKYTLLLGDENLLYEGHIRNQFFEAGVHTVSFPKSELFKDVEYSAIDAVFVINPKESTAELTNTQKGLFVTNSGEVVYKEGINYYSPNIFQGCMGNIFNDVPCERNDMLRLYVK